MAWSVLIQELGKGEISTEERKNGRSILLYVLLLCAEKGDYSRKTLFIKIRNVKIETLKVVLNKLFMV